MHALVEYTRRLRATPFQCSCYTSEFPRHILRDIPFRLWRTKLILNRSGVPSTSSRFDEDGSRDEVETLILNRCETLCA